MPDSYNSGLNLLPSCGKSRAGADSGLNLSPSCGKSRAGADSWSNLSPSCGKSRSFVPVSSFGLDEISGVMIVLSLVFLMDMVTLPSGLKFKVIYFHQKLAVIHRVA